MSEQQGQHEPTMEEILASIRRIISEDGQPAESSADEPEPDVLELTEMVEEDEPPSPPSEPPPPAEPEWAPEPARATAPEPELEPDPGEALLSAAAAAASAAAFAGLMNGRSSLDRETRVSSGSGPSLEDIVREMLKPMLKEWLDDNLPGLVERMVRKEIERISRNG